MPSLTFPYHAFLFRDPETGEERKRFFPIIPVKLFRGGRIYNQNILCLVDSGSECNLFEEDVAKLVGINKIRKGGPKEIKGIGDKSEPVVGYKHDLFLYLDGHKFNTKIYFSSEVSGCILGRIGFFNLFDSIEFREKEKIIRIAWNEN